MLREDRYNAGPRGCDSAQCGDLGIRGSDQLPACFKRFSRFHCGASAQGTQFWSPSGLLRSRGSGLRFSTQFAPVHSHVPRNGETERRSHSRFRVDPNLAAHSLNDLPANCQSKASSWHFPTMQAFEKSEYLIVIFRRNPDAAVAYLDEPFPLPRFARNANFNWGNAAIFDRVTYKILKHFDQMALPFVHDRQGIDRQCRAAFLDGLLQILERLVHDAVQLNRLPRIIEF